MTTKSNFPKFRAWHIANKTMHEVLKMDFEINSIYIGNQDKGFYQDDIFEPISEFILMQSTGLKDKNGIEIFEGDIVIWNDGGGETELNPEKGWIRKAVVHIKPDLYFKLTTDTPSGRPTHGFHYGNFIYTDTEKHLKIMGNIHAHLELLQGDRE